MLEEGRWINNAGGGRLRLKRGLDIYVQHYYAYNLKLDRPKPEKVGGGHRATQWHTVLFCAI